MLLSTSLRVSRLGIPRLGALAGLQMTRHIALLPKPLPLRVPNIPRLSVALVPAPSPSPALVSTAWRSMARLTNRRAGVRVEEETSTTTSVTEQKSFDEQRQERDQTTYEPEASTENTLTPAIRRHLTKVYGTMMAAMGFAAGGAVAGAMAPAFALPAMIGSILTIIGLAFMPREKLTLRQNLFLATGALMGMGIGPLLAATAPGVVLAAAAGTSAIFGGFTIAALRAKQASMLKLQGPLLGGLMVIFLAGLSSIFLPMLGVTSPAILGALYNINLYGGLALFSIFISYDTQLMIEAYRAGDDDHITPALNMFLNVFNIFIRLINIFRGDD